MWRQHRKLVAQGFSTNSVNEYFPMFNKHINGMVEALRPNVGQGVFNLKTEVNVHLMNSILETTLGHDIDDTDKRNYEIFFNK